MHRTLAAIGLLAMALGLPVQQASAQDPLGGGVIGAAAGAAIASQGQVRSGGYYYYRDGCYRRRPDGAWVVVPPRYCGPPGPPVAIAPVRDELSDRMMEYRARCEDGDRRA